MDFDCYENNAKWLESDNRKIEGLIRLSSGISGDSKNALQNYMRTQDEAVKACDLAVKLAYEWQIETPPKTHRDLYDVMSARCHYSIRKQQNDFLHDLYSIKTG